MACSSSDAERGASEPRGGIDPQELVDAANAFVTAAEKHEVSDNGTEDILRDTTVRPAYAPSGHWVPRAD